MWNLIQVVTHSNDLELQHRTEANSMNQKIVQVTKQNYHLFDDMIFYRANGRHKNEAEQAAPRDFTEQYAILDKGILTTYAMQTEDKFAGYICLTYIPKITQNNNGFIFVDDIWVNPDYRRMGIAERLMQAAEDLARENNIYGLRLYVGTGNDAGMALYKKCGLVSKYGEAMLMEKEMVFK